MGWDMVDGDGAVDMVADVNGNKGNSGDSGNSAGMLTVGRGGRRSDGGRGMDGRCWPVVR